MKQMPTDGVIPRPSLKAQTMSSDSRTPSDDAALRDRFPDEVLGRPIVEARVDGRVPGGAGPRALGKGVDIRDVELGADWKDLEAEQESVKEEP